MEKVKIVYDLIIAIWQTIKPYVDNVPKNIETWNRITDELEQKKHSINGLDKSENRCEEWLYNKLAADFILYLSERSKNA